MYQDTGILVHRYAGREVTIALLNEHSLTQLTALSVRAQAADIATWRGREALRIENGLVLLPGFPVTDATVEVMIAAEGAAYPGIAFRAADALNYELVYGAPHNSGRWDALQYDPVFHGSNTWQVYNGPCYQRAATVTTGYWYRLRVYFCGQSAAVTIDDQPPLVVEQLAYPARAGLIGIWSYLPAYFRELRVWSCDCLDNPAGVPPRLPQGVVEEWFVEGFGVVRAEPNGVVNLNRYMSPAVGEARLTRRLEVEEETNVRFEFGFSDALALELDGQVVFTGENTYHGGDDRSTQGYIECGTHVVESTLGAGSHVLAADLKVSEGFGWGFAVAARGEAMRWLPAAFG